MPVIVAHKKSAPQVHDLYELQSMNLDLIYRHSEHFKETQYSQKKENSNNIKKIKCYNCDIKEHYTQDCYKSKKLQTLAAIR